jgi:hypothetical protein
MSTRDDESANPAGADEAVSSIQRPNDEEASAEAEARLRSLDLNSPPSQSQLSSSMPTDFPSLANYATARLGRPSSGTSFGAVEPLIDDLYPTDIGIAPFPPPRPSPPPRLPVASTARPTQPRRNISDIALARWQPDSEVTECPICHIQFGFLVRKHHCRKCGRVVCATCSPHNIVIPYEYVVRPPGDATLRRRSGYFAEEGHLSRFGGERVRLCNPCVPDPNNTPPQTQTQTQTGATPNSSRLHQRSRSSNVDRSVGGMAFFGDYNAVLSSASASQRHRSVSMLPPGPTSSASSSRTRRTAGDTDRNDIQQFIQNMRTAIAVNSEARNRPLPPPPPIIAEEDECPVCHLELPSRSLPDFESLREDHITACIADRSASGSHGTPPTRSARRTGVFPYVATEKDCMAGDEPAECIICLDEFRAGVPMARLECLCRFHRSCISEWFVNHPGRCPVHQHDSFGY